MLEKLSRLIAKKIKETDPEGPGSVEIFEWELGIRLNLIATIILTLLFGWLFGHIILSLVSLLTFILIRKASGGIHIKSLTLCAIVSAFIFSVIPFLKLEMLEKVLLSCISFLIFLKWAPNDFEEVYTTNSFKKLKWASVIIVLVSFISQWPVLILTVFAQAITILPIWKSWRGGGDIDEQNSTLHV
ncbi:accessory gene regulator B family protein [Paenibacillus sp. FSL R7-0340]|uniref:accessory gene regulator ArgB-like protein n=1 Tax=Paenibacillus sp. FSL R7-0340 TaxID=2921684 RepID=UPI0030F7B67F